jgi:hypothetical protein
MARLFITKREINFISDITKEIVKDVIGQKIYYYPVSETKTKSHEVYDESLKKIFDNPINIDVLVNSEFQTETKINKFGIDAQFILEVYIQHRDMIEKGINPSIGDYFSFGAIFYEITEYKYMRTIYGQAENIDGVSLTGTRVRESQFKALTNGPTDIKYNDADAVQDTFVQQRGYATDANGEETGDVRDLVKNGVLEEPLTGPKQVSPAGDSTSVGSAFYDEE